MAITWGPAVGPSSNGQFKLGVAFRMSPSTVTESTTSVTVYADVYVWTRYSTIDQYNTLSIGGSFGPWSGAATINTTVNSPGWSSSNIVLVKTVSKTVTPSTATATTLSFSASLKGLEYPGTGYTATVSTSYTVPKKPSSSYTPVVTKTQQVVPGRVVIQRVGSLWSWSFSIWRNGEWEVETSGTWEDTGSAYDAPVAKVAVSIQQYKTVTLSRMAVRSVKVYDVTGTGVSSTTVIAGDGDVVTFDMRRCVVLLNGDQYSRVPSPTGGMLPMNALVDKRSSFFALPTDQSTVSAEADDGVSCDATVTFRERWL